MDLRHLRIFLRLYRHRSVSAAAHELNLSQPALSKVLRRIEAELGVPLFDRLPRGLEPTEYGHALAEAAKSIDGSFRHMLKRIDATRGGVTGEITVGAGATWRDRLLPAAVARLVERRPGVRVIIRSGASDELVAALVDGEVDLALVPIRDAEPFAREIRSETLVTDTLVVAARRDHPWVRRDDVPLAELATLRWAAATGQFVRERFQSVFRQNGLTPPHPVVATEDMNCLLDIVARSDLVAYVPRLRLAYRREPDLAVITSRQAETNRETGLLMRRKAKITPLQQELIVDLRAAIAALQL